jgi:hypothetical protein
MTAGEARSMGRDDLEVMVVTPEHEPLSLFGRPMKVKGPGPMKVKGPGRDSGPISGV